ncbi:MAG: hypothetical protein WCD08_15570 [Steroidobacteraceae bacterium]
MELRVALMLAMALLCAQWAAQAHAYSHLSSPAVATHQLDLKGKLCSDCLSFAPLLSTATGSSFPSVPAPQGIDPAPVSVSYSLIGRDFPAAFRSRAPPFSR